MRDRNMVMLAGGGTLGSVIPLLALVEAWQKKDPHVSCVWVGTLAGPERELVEAAKIPFVTLAVPKVDRGVPLLWPLLPFRLLISLFRAAQLLREYRPTWLISAGAYVAVPLGWLAPFFGTRVALHQLDVAPGLANLVLAPTASKITSTWPDARAQFFGKTVEVIGSAVPIEAAAEFDRAKAAKQFGIDPDRKTLLVMGGGTGSLFLNTVFSSMAEDLAKDLNVIHVTGKGKEVFEGRSLPRSYRAYPLLSIAEIQQAMHLADAVVSRAGMATLAEFVAFKKAVVLVPLPDSPQEKNAKKMQEAGAALVLSQKKITAHVLHSAIRDALDPMRRKDLEARMGRVFETRGVAERWVEILLK